MKAKQLYKAIMESISNKIQSIIDDSINLNLIPRDAGFSSDAQIVHPSKNYKYEYFGNCINTVPNIWDATQLAQFLQTCDIIPVKDVYNKIYSGDKLLPKKLQNAIIKLEKYGELNDLSKICAGINEYQSIMCIYISEFDIHYFFDCKI